MLLTIDGVLTPQELSTVRALLSQARWASGSATAGVQAATVKNNEQVEEGSPPLAQAREIVLTAFPTAIYEPHQRAAWDEAYARFKALVKK